MEQKVLTTLNFNLRGGRCENKVIYAVINDKSRQQKISLNEKVLSGLWDKKRQLCKIDNCLSEGAIHKQMEINKKISDVRRIYEENFLYICTSDLIALIREHITNEAMANEKNLTAGRKYSAKKAINDAFKVYIDTHQVSEGTKENVGYMVNQFCRYIDESGRDSLNHLKKDGLLKYRQYLIANGKTNKRANDCVSWVSLIINSVMVENPQFKKLGLAEISIKKLPSEEREEKFALTAEEIEKLKAVELNEELAKYRDAFLLQTMLGWRRSDFAEFVNHNTKVYRGVEYIKAKKTQKKKLIAHCIVTPQIAELREKVQGVKFSDIYRRNIRKIAEKAQLDRVINDKGEKVYQKIASHIARHTFITAKANEGWEMEKIAFFTAHANPTTQQVMTKFYIHQTEEKIIDLFLKKMEQEKVESPAQTTNNTEEQILIDDYKKAFYYLNGNMGEVMEIKDITELFLKVHNEEQKFLSVGVPLRVIKKLYNTSGKSIQEKKEELQKIMEVFKSKKK